MSAAPGRSSASQALSSSSWPIGSQAIASRSVAFSHVRNGRSVPGVFAALPLQVAQGRLGERPRCLHAVDVVAVHLGFARAPRLFGELAVVSASALSNALAVNGADNQRIRVSGRLTTLSGISSLDQVVDGDVVEKHAASRLDDGGPCRLTSSRRVPSGTRKRIAASEKVKAAPGTPGT